MGAGVENAVRVARSGGLVCYPTDTLFGLGADAYDRTAVTRLVEVKGRPSGQPISIAVSSLEEIEPLARLAPVAREFLRNALPGPYTVLAVASPEARRELDPRVLGMAGSIGIRIPDHPLAREIARRVGVITSTSANRHGEPPSGSLAEARRVFGSAVGAYVDGLPRPSGHPSTIVDLRRAEPHILRRR